MHRPTPIIDDIRARTGQTDLQLSTILLTLLDRPDYTTFNRQRALALVDELEMDFVDLADGLCDLLVLERQAT